MKTRKARLLLIVGILIVFDSCNDTKEIAYMQTVKSDIKSQIDNKQGGQYEVRFKPKDLLTISVVSSEISASKSFNLFTPQVSETSGNTTYGMPTLQTYLIDNNGNIDFPIIGMLKVAGITRNELEKLLQEKLSSAFRNERPVITIRITNYSVNILGEVARPGKYQTYNDRLTIFEGLALAGDMTIYGRRDNVKILREDINGDKKLLYVNLKDKNIINSPAYYLEQNDVVYVEPNESRSNSSSINAGEYLSVSAVSILISLATLMLNIF